MLHPDPVGAMVKDLASIFYAHGISSAGAMAKRLRWCSAFSSKVSSPTMSQAQNLFYCLLIPDFLGFSPRFITYKF
jgi:hypothetical protein